MRNPTPAEIAEKLINLSGIDLFENTRKRDYVEIRALACFLMREKLNMRLCSIAKFFQDNFKPMDHATVIYAVKNYPYYKKANSSLEKLELSFRWEEGLNFEEMDRIEFLEMKLTTLQNKYDKLIGNLDNPLIKAVHDITDRKQIWEMADQIVLMKKAWKWKSKEFVDKCEVIEAGEGISGSRF
tara:strand:- start:609 stop:1160 length:552 start_codon:yes stop_codon:yes gene_type:complete